VATPTLEASVPILLGEKMTYALPFVKFAVNGHFGSSASNQVDQWQAGFHLTKNGGVVGGTSELSSFLTNVRAAVITFHQSSAVGASTNCFLDEMTGAYIGTDGHYLLGALQSTTRVPFSTSTPGTGGALGPWTQATCLTLRSLLLRGPGSHGRSYWPTPGATIDGPTGVRPPANVTAMLAAAKVMLDDFNAKAATNFGTGCNLGLVSAKGSGFQSPVIRVGLGQKFDRMESREHRISEAHQYSNLVVSTAFLEAQDAEFREQAEELLEDVDDRP
jgi:hypothetical protein